MLRWLENSLSMSFFLFSCSGGVNALGYSPSSSLPPLAMLVLEGEASRAPCSDGPGSRGMKRNKLKGTKSNSQFSLIFADFSWELQHFRSGDFCRFQIAEIAILRNGHLSTLTCQFSLPFRRQFHRKSPIPQEKSNSSEKN